MSARQIRRFLLLTSALGTAALVASAVAAVPGEGDVSELFDPRAIAAGVCGGGAQHATTFKPMQLALVSRPRAPPPTRRARRCGTASAR